MAIERGTGNEGRTRLFIFDDKLREQIMIAHPDFHFVNTSIRELAAIVPLIADKRAQSVVKRAIKSLKHTSTLHLAIFEKAEYNHKTESLYYEARDMHVDIDTKLVPLLKLLWSMGCDTLFSCQGNPGSVSFNDHAYIMFASGTAADTFMRALEIGGCKEVKLLTNCERPNLTFDECDMLYSRSFRMTANLCPVHGRVPEEYMTLPPLRVTVYFSSEMIESITRAVEKYILECCTDNEQRRKRRRVQRKS